MQICATCGAKNIDNLQVCWQCRRPLGRSAASGTEESSDPPYRARPRGIRPAVGLFMLIAFAAGIGAWWYLRPPDPIELPPRFEGEPEVNEELSAQVTDLIRKRMDIGVAIARYGRASDTFPRYAIIAFRDLHPPFTADYLLRDWRTYIPVGSTLESRLVLDRKIDGVRFRCHRARPQHNLLPEAGAAFRWCSWQLGDEAGILLDRVSAEIRRTLELTRHVRDLVT